MESGMFEDGLSTSWVSRSLNTDALRCALPTITFIVKTALPSSITLS
jgi:hypothetical protein